MSRNAAWRDLALIAFVLAGASAGAQQSAPDTQSYRTEHVRYAGDSVTLAALLMVPARSARPAAAAVIIQGSGTSDRSNQWAREIAEVLVDAGLVVLLTDKRGSGASGGDWRAADFSDLAGDALAGVTYLRGRREVNAGKIGLVGLSQGGWIAPLAAARSDDVAFVVNISGASVSFAEQSFHEMAATARQAGLPEPYVQEVLDLNRAAGDYLITGDWPRYERARERALQTPWRQIAAGFPGSATSPVWEFLRGVVAYDPMPYWIQLTEPVLVIYGADDERDNVPVAESVRRLEHAFGSAGKTNYRIVVVPGAGHGFLDREHRLMPEFSRALEGWVREHALQP